MAVTEWCFSRLQRWPVFPPPWSVEEQPACFVVRDGNGQQLAYVYFEDEPGRRSAAKLLERDRGETDCRKYRETAGAIEPPSDLGSAMSLDRQVTR